MLAGLLTLMFVVAGPLLLGTAIGAEAVSYTPPAIETQPVAPPSGTMTLTGSGFIPFANVEIFLGGTPLGTTTSTADGTFSFTFKAPANLGTYELTATDGSNDLTTTFRVTTGGEGGGSGGLPFTGTSSSTWLAQLGVGLLAVGALIVAVVRTSARKRSDERADVNA
jgi:hypothetical protein